MGLRVVTFADSIDDRIASLQGSCEENSLVLDIVGVGEKWIRNAFKLRLLNDYLHHSSLVDDDVLLVVDAFDVIVNASEDTILQSFEEFGLDIVFSGEANYYFRNRVLSAFYWRFYPRIENTVYHYLNSGSFVGRVRALRSLMGELSASYGIDYSDDNQLEQIRSDQSVYSRYYADYKAGVFHPDFTLGLDAFQKMMGCSGGRMHAAVWPKFNWLQDYLVFKYERKLLKGLKLVAYQNVLKDLYFDKAEKTFKNRLTKTRPNVIHLPGTYKNFGTILRTLKEGGGSFSLFKPLAVFLSLIGYVRSIIRFGFISLFNKGKTRLSDIYPIVFSKPTDVYKQRSVKAKMLESDETFTLKNDEGVVSDIPAILSVLAGREVILLARSEYLLRFLKEKGIEPILWEKPIEDIKTDVQPEAFILVQNEKFNQVEFLKDDGFTLISTEFILTSFRNIGHDYWLLPKHRQFATYQ